MAEFVSSFMTGFERVIAERFPRLVKGVTVLNVFDGLIHYSYNGDSRNLEKVVYFNNTFFVLKTMKGCNGSFKQLVNAVCSSKHFYLVNKGTFRVRFTLANQFTKVDKVLARRAEDHVLQNSKLAVDRLSPSTEVWYAIRSDGFAFCGQLVFKREFTEKNLNKGELRPELAYLLCDFADVDGDDIVVEPFAGFGSIPVQIVRHFSCKRLFVSDLDSEKIAVLSRNRLFESPLVSVCVADAFVLSHVPDGMASLVVTDPPWGFFEDIGDITEFYRRMFCSFARVLMPSGRMVILSARVDNLLDAARLCGVDVVDSLHTLVNGKKASVFLCRFRGALPGGSSTPQ